MRFVKAFIVAMAALGAASAAAHEQGPPVGANFPAAEAQDQSGAVRNVAELSGENGLVLLVTRSADWCPYCQRQLIGLEGVRDQIEARGWRVAAVTTDSVRDLGRFARRRDIGFPMLSDEDSEIIRALELLDPQFPPGSRRHGLPVPTLFFIASDGVVAARLGDADYRVRPAPEQAVATIDSLGR